MVAGEINEANSSSRGPHHRYMFCRLLKFSSDIFSWNFMEYQRLQCSFCFPCFSESGEFADHNHPSHLHRSGKSVWGSGHLQGSWRRVCILLHGGNVLALVLTESLADSEIMLYILAARWLLHLDTHVPTDTHLVVEVQRALRGRGGLIKGTRYRSQ